MARFSQFVLFACIAIVSSFSYTLPKVSQNDQDLENDEHDAYIDDLIARLSLEELLILKNYQQMKTDVDERDGNSGNCNSTSKVIYPKTARGTDEITKYRIFNSQKNPMQSVKFQTCNGQENYRCKPATSDHYYYGCCVQKRERKKMLVLSKKSKKKGESYVDPATGTQILGITEQEVFLDSICACEDFIETSDTLLKNIPKEKKCLQI